MSLKASLVTLPLLALGLAGPLAARVPPDPPDLIGRLADPTVPPDEQDSSVIREKAVRLTFDPARDGGADRLRLLLFDGSENLVLERTREVIRRGGVVVWTGRVRDEPASSVLFWATPGILIANVSTQPTGTRSGRHFEIRPLRDGRHVLREFDPSTIAPELPPDPPDPDEPAQPRTCPDPQGTIDVLVLFTEAVRKKVPGSMRGLIEYWLDQTNDSFANSDIRPRLRLAGAEEISYDESESKDLAKDLRSLKDRGGAMADAHEIRNTVGADLVVLVVEYGPQLTKEIGCGKGFVMERETQSFEKSAFAVVDRTCADRDFTFAHELGHLMGARHDWDDDGSTKTPFRFSHGFVHAPEERSGPAFRTIMAKDTICVHRGRRCDRVPFWSNPNKKLPGTGIRLGAVGEQRPSNNAETLNRTADTVSKFRCGEN